MATFSTYYATGSLQRGTLRHHKRGHTSLRNAKAAAVVLAEKHTLCVTVLRNGIEVFAACPAKKR